MPQPVGETRQSVGILREDNGDALLVRLRENLQIVDDNRATILRGGNAIGAIRPEQGRGFDGVGQVVGLNAKVLQRQIAHGLAHFKLPRRDGGKPHRNLLRQAMAEIIDRHGMVRSVGVGIREFFTTQNLGTFAQGDIAGTVLIKGASQTGTSIIVDGFTSATGTVKQGTRLTFAGDTQVYTVQADATIASNETTLVIYPSKASAGANDGAVTFETAFKESFIYHPSSIACAVVAPAPFDDNTSSVVQVNGLSLRVSYQKSGLDEIVVVDTLAGVKLIHPEGGVVFQG